MATTKAYQPFFSRMPKHLFAFFNLLLFMLCLHEAMAQDSKQIDSLQREVNRYEKSLAGNDPAEVGMRDTVKATLFNAISREYKYINIDSTFRYAGLALSLSKALNFKSGIAEAYNNLGHYYMANHDLQRAYDSYTRSLALREQLKDRKGVAGSHHNIGIVYFNEGKTREALDHLFVALAINDSLKNHLWKVFNLNVIGLCYRLLKQHEMALKFFKEALKTIRQNKLEEELSYIYNNIGFTYNDMGEYEQASNYYNLTLRLHKEAGNLGAIGTTLGNIGSNYVTAGNYKEALHYYKESLKYIKIPENKDYYLQYVLNIGSVYSRLGDYPKANKYLRDILPGLIAYGNKEWIFLCYQELATVDSALGNYHDALRNYQQYIVYRDSLVNHDATKKSVQLQMQYEFDKIQAADSIQFAKQKEISSLKLQRQKTITYTGFGIVAVTLLLLFVVYRSYQKQQLANRKLKEAQEQLVKSEKLSAFGVMATRVSHEILNPLNFINNFSELSKDLVHELMNSENETEKKETAQLLEENLKKINGHGKRAEAIVKQLQEHSRKGSAHEFFEGNVQ